MPRLESFIVEDLCNCVRLYLMLLAGGRTLSLLGCLNLKKIKVYCNYFGIFYLDTFVRTGDNVTPFLDHGNLDHPGVDLRPHADLLGHVEAVLDLLEAGHQLGHVLAGRLGVEAAVLLRVVPDNGLYTVLESSKLLDIRTETFKNM